jgi:Ca-activated chloride channel homolog
MPPKTDRRKRREVFGIIITALIFSFFSVVFSQDTEEKPNKEHSKTTKPVLESKSPQQTRTQKTGEYTIDLNVDLVVNYISVFDKAGRFVTGLKRDNFKIFEDGSEQKISSFSQEDVPIDMGILMDTSGSMRPKMDRVKESALAFVQSGNPQDEIFIIGFSDETELIQDYTSDIDEIKDALDNVAFGGGTVAYDAVYLGVDKAHAGKKPKKALIVITDGEDRDSYYKLDELLTKVQESDVQIFCIGFLNEYKKNLFHKSIPEKARDALNRISEESGGKAFFPEQIGELPNIVSEIAAELRRQYSIGFFSSNAARDGSWRRVKIELKNAAADNHVRYRRGYYAPKSQ